MNVLVACEYSGIVRDAFENAGCNAWSCDILPTESEQTKAAGKHIQADVLRVIEHIKQYGDTVPFVDDAGNVFYLPKFDLLIGFPPCTYLTYSGMAYWYDDGRAMKRINAAKFFMQLWESGIPYISLENPQGIMTNIFRKPDMVIHPYYFGDREMKRTCLWLKNLPALKYVLQDNLFEKASATDKPEPVQIQIRKKSGKPQKRYFTDCLVNNKFKTGHEKSKTFPGIARAMAEQWTEYLNHKSTQ